MLAVGLSPDTVACNTVLLAYANAGDADGAAHLLQHFERRAADECPNARPDVCSPRRQAGRDAQSLRTLAAMMAG